MSDPNFQTPNELAESQKIVYTEGEMTTEPNLSNEGFHRKEKLKQQLHAGRYTQDPLEIKAGLLEEAVREPFDIIGMEETNENPFQNGQEVITEIEEEDCETPQLSKRKTVILKKPKNPQA